MAIDDGNGFATVLPEADPPLAETYKQIQAYTSPSFPSESGR